MRIFNEDKTKELDENEIDVDKGYLKEDKLFIKHHDEQPEIQEQSHQELIEEYPESGGKVYEKVIDVPYQPKVLEHDEYEDILIFKLFTEKELAEDKIQELKQKLLNTDYQAIKFAEGEFTAEEYEPMRLQRKTWRKEINELEEEIKNVTK